MSATIIHGDEPAAISAAKATADRLRHEERLDRITGLTEIIEVFVRLKTFLFGHKDAQNVQKRAKNDQKSAL